MLTHILFERNKYNTNTNINSNLYSYKFRAIPYIGYINHNNNILNDNYKKPYTLNNLFLKSPFTGYIDHMTLLNKNKPFTNPKLNEDKKDKLEIKTSISNEDKKEELEIKTSISNEDKKEELEILDNKDDYEETLKNELEVELKSYEIINYPIDNTVDEQTGIPKTSFYRVADYIYKKIKK